MDPSDSFNVIERSAYYFLSEDEDGFSLWSVLGDDPNEPVLVFPSGGDGQQRALAAFRRETRFGRWSRILLLAAIVAAPAWIGALVAQRWFDLFGPDTFSTFGQGFQPARLELWFSVISSVANAAFIISVGLSVVIWLHRRYRREG